MSCGHVSALQEHLSCGQFSDKSAADRTSESIRPPASWAQPLGPAQCCLLAGLLLHQLPCSTVGPVGQFVRHQWPLPSPVTMAVTAWRSQKCIASSSDAHAHPEGASAS